MTKPGSDHLIDSVVAYGTPDQIAARLREHLDAGADHVAIQVLGGHDTLLHSVSRTGTTVGPHTRELTRPCCAGSGLRGPRVVGSLGCEAHQIGVDHVGGLIDRPER